MRLYYRGASYEHNPPTLEVTEGEIQGQYRGANWRCRTYAGVPLAETSYDLKYRGATYSTHGLARKLDRAMVRQQLDAITPSMANREIGRVHRANLEENLKRRMQVALERGDFALLKMLESERQEVAAL